MLLAQNLSTQQQTFQQLFQKHHQQHQQHPQHHQQHPSQPDRTTLPLPLDNYRADLLDFDDQTSNLSLSSSPASLHLSPLSVSATAFPSSSTASFLGDYTHDYASHDFPHGLAQQDPAPFFSDIDSEDLGALDPQDVDCPIFGGAGVGLSNLSHSPSRSTTMQAESSWLSPQNQLSRQLAGRNPHSHHHRESSLSSLGSASAGPASPFSQNTSNPHIAITDTAGGDGFSSMPPFYDDSGFQLTKSLAASSAGSSAHDGSSPSFYTHSSSLPMTHPHPQQSPQTSGQNAAQSQFGSMFAAQQQQQRPKAGSSGLLPPPDLSMGSMGSLGSMGSMGSLGSMGSMGSMGSNRSQPASVASSIASNSPATPSLDQPDDESARRRNVPVTFPKLETNMANLYGTDDQLYGSGFGIPTSAPAALPTHHHQQQASQQASQPQRNTASPSHDLFGQRLQTMSGQYLRHSPALTSAGRDSSPFRQNSPLHQDFHSPVSSLRYGALQPSQQQQQQQRQHPMAASQSSNTPQTMSPKDAVLDYQNMDTDGDNAANLLFAQSTPDSSQLGTTDFSSMAGGASDFHFLPQTLPQISQQYPFVTTTTPQQQPQPQQQQQPPQQPQQLRPQPQQRPRPHQPPAQAHQPSQHAGSRQPLTVGGAPIELVQAVPNPHRALAGADGGTYTCTYHGCSLRFDTPLLLQKHKREGHRQAHSLGSNRRSDGSGAGAGAAAANGVVMNSQAGPHRCDRINPSTGKPCNTVFSRPYDLTRHEDTIHNARKQKVRCALCTEEKTFSRADALTRHFRVCHPDVELRGKHRKRVTRNV